MGINGIFELRIHSRCILVETDCLFSTDLISQMFNGICLQKNYCNGKLFGRLIYHLTMIDSQVDLDTVSEPK